jgi:hypothetical protein
MDFPKETELRDRLNGFCGTECYHRHWSGRLMWTDGMEFLAEQCGAYWLLDIIASYQGETVICQNERAMEFQVWTLKVLEGRKAVVTMKLDSEEPDLIRQEIEFTDFPMSSVEVWVEGGVALLPSEH